MQTTFRSRIHHYVTRISIFLIMVVLIAGMVGCMGGCDATSQNLEIQDWYDLAAVRSNLAGHHRLMNDLDSTTPGYEELASPTANSGMGWTAIKGAIPEVGWIGFEGSFDGQGYEIRDLFMNSGPSQEYYVGLFGIVGKKGRIENIGLVNAAVNGSVNVGGLVGYNGGTVSNSYFTGSVNGSSSVGGLVGSNGGTLRNSYYNYDEVLINGENIITLGALFDEDFDQWLANDKFLDVNERLSQEYGYYLINDVHDLKSLLAFGQDATLKFRLTSDLDLADEPNFYIPYFAGEFDGNSHKVSNLSFNFGFVSKVGLFGYLTPGGRVRELGIENMNITAAWYVGGLVGVNRGILSNCYATGSVTGSSSVGGLVGWNGGTVNSSYSSGSVTCSDYVGGLMGWNRGTVTNSYSSGSVAGYRNVGGLVGKNDATVSSSYSTGNVTGVYNIGGLVGENWYGTVSDSYFTGSVTGEHDVGGLVGENWYGTVSDSYSTGSVTGEHDVGGLVGANWYDATVSDSYSTGRVTAEWNVGGLVGMNPYGTVSNSFWDVQTSGQTTSDGGTGKTTAEMQNIATFSGATWNITTVGGLGERNTGYIWNIVHSVTYPFLSWQP